MIYIYDERLTAQIACLAFAVNVSMFLYNAKNPFNPEQARRGSDLCPNNAYKKNIFSNKAP